MKLMHSSLNSSSSKVIENNPFTFVSVNEQVLPKSGWKIHISANEDNFRHVLLLVSRYCIDHKVTFKFINTSEAFLQNTSSNERAEISGKFITLYPLNQDIAETTMHNLSELLLNYSGPLILNDFVFRKSTNIFFRYGIFTVKNRNNPSEYELHGPNGQTFRDYDRDYTVLPDWIQLPDGWTNKNLLLPSLMNFHPKKILKHSNAGNIYAGSDNSGREVVIKEARKEIIRFPKLLETEFAQNEFLQSEEIHTDTEKPIQEISEKFATYHVYLKASGSTVQEYTSANSLFLTTNQETIIKNFHSSKTILSRAWKIIESIHFMGKKNIDIHPSNFVFDRATNNLTLIDLETIDNFTCLIQTPDFWFPDMAHDSFQIQDIRRFGLFVMYLFGQANKYIAKNNEVAKLIDLTTEILKPYGKVSGLEALLRETLLAKTPNYELISDTIRSLEFHITQDWKHINNFPVISRRITPQKPLEVALISEKPQDITKMLIAYFNHQVSPDMIHEFLSRHMQYQQYKIGLTGLAGLLILCTVDITQNMCFIKEIHDALQKHQIHRNNSLSLIAYKEANYIDPYMMNGVAGVLFAESFLPTTLQLNHIREIAESIAVPFSKRLTYLNGLLGVADAILTLAQANNDIHLWNVGAAQLKQVIALSKLQSNGHSVVQKNYKSSEISIYNTMLKKWILSHSKN